MTLELFLKERRQALKIPQGSLAALLGFESPQFVSNVERGKCRWPPKHFPLLAEVLEVDLRKMVDMRKEDLAKEVEDEISRTLGGNSWMRKHSAG